MRSIKLVILALLALPTALFCADNEEDMGNRKDLPLYSSGVEVGVVNNSRLDEISGIAPSSRYKDCFWVINDSGDKACLYLINIDGELVATLSLPVVNRDWEALTTADGYIYVGEVGDNDARYVNKKIYKVAEPTTIDVNKRGQLLTTKDVETMAFNFSDGVRDCETLMFDPISKELVLVSKRESRVRFYTTPFIATYGDDVEIVNKCGLLDFTLATAGDISLAGDKILIKNYEKIFYWERTEGQTIAEALAVKPIELPYDAEPQGEAIAWCVDDDAFVTVSEEVSYITPIIYRYTSNISQKNR